MARRTNLTSFTQLDLVKQIEVGNLMALLALHRQYFEDRGFLFPQVVHQEPDYRRLALILLASDEDTPPDLIEALHVIGNVGTAERLDDLLQIAFLNGVETGDAGITPIDLAVRLWLRVPRAVEKLERDELFEKKLKFEHFPAREDSAAVAVEDLPGDLTPIEAEIDAWLQEHKRGPGCNIDRVVSGAEVRFLIDHGLPCKRERNRKGRESSCLYYRPERSDIVVYDAAANELRMHTSTIGEMRLYVATFGRHLFADEHRFTFSRKYTLEPLKRRGRDALNCRGVDGLDSIKLREVQWAWDGAFQHVEIHRGSDLFFAFTLREMSIPVEPVLKKAVFEVRLTGVEKPRSAWIRPPNTAAFGRGEESALIEQWLRGQGFILVGTKVADEEVDTVVAGV